MYPCPHTSAIISKDAGLHTKQLVLLRYGHSLYGPHRYPFFFLLGIKGLNSMILDLQTYYDHVLDYFSFSIFQRQRHYLKMFTYEWL